MVETTYRKREQHIGDYSKLLNMLESLEPEAIKAACKQLGIPYLPQIGCRLLAKRLEKAEDTNRLLDTILRKPVTSVPLPTHDADFIIALAVYNMAEREGKEPDKVNIPEAIPDSYGFYEADDPSCKECPYSESCESYTISLQPICFGLLHNSESKACINCYYNPWCGFDLVVEP